MRTGERHTLNFPEPPSSLQEPTTANRSRNFKIPDCTLALPTGGKGRLEDSMVGSLWHSLQDLFCPFSPPQLASQGCPVYHTDKKKETHTKSQGCVPWAVMSLSWPLFTEWTSHSQGTSRLGQATCDFIVEKDFTERAMLNISGLMVKLGAFRNSYLGPLPKVGSTLPGTFRWD